MLGLCAQGHAGSDQAETALSDDGREVRLHADGNWEYVSQDRYAVTRDGRRIRLKSDGSWVQVDGELAWPASSSPSISASHGLTLDEYIIESMRSARHKNSREVSRMLITLRLAGALADRSLINKEDIDLADSRGRRYEILSLSLTDGGLRVIADDSPRWWGVKYFRLTLPGGAFGADAPLEITVPMTSVINREVTEFSR